MITGAETGQRNLPADRDTYFRSLEHPGVQPPCCLTAGTRAVWGAVEDAALPPARRSKHFVEGRQ